MLIEISKEEASYLVQAIQGRQEQPFSEYSGLVSKLNMILNEKVAAPLPLTAAEKNADLIQSLATNMEKLLRLNADPSSSKEVPSPVQEEDPYPHLRLTSSLASIAARHRSHPSALQASMQALASIAQRDPLNMPGVGPNSFIPTPIYHPRKVSVHPLAKEAKFSPGESREAAMAKGNLLSAAQGSRALDVEQKLRWRGRNFVEKGKKKEAASEPQNGDCIMNEPERTEMEKGALEEGGIRDDSGVGLELGDYLTDSDDDDDPAGFGNV